MCSGQGITRLVKSGIARGTPCPHEMEEQVFRRTAPFFVTFLLEKTLPPKGFHPDLVVQHKPRVKVVHILGGRYIRTECHLSNLETASLSTSIIEDIKGHIPLPLRGMQVRSNHEGRKVQKSSPCPPRHHWKRRHVCC